MKLDAFVVQAEKPVVNVPASVAKQYERTCAILHIVQAVEWPAFSTVVNQRIADLLEGVQPAHAEGFYLAAAEDYEKQGDREQRLAFAKLCTMRYKKAHGCFLKAANREKAAHVHAKIEHVRSKQAL